MYTDVEEWSEIRRRVLNGVIEALVVDQLRAILRHSDVVARTYPPPGDAFWTIDSYMQTPSKLKKRCLQQVAIMG